MEYIFWHPTLIYWSFDIIILFLCTIIVSFIISLIYQLGTIRYIGITCIWHPTALANIGNIEKCHSSFTYHVDTLNGVLNSYLFYSNRSCLRPSLSSSKFVFMWDHLSLKLFSYDSFILWDCPPVRLSSCELIFLCGCLHVRSSYCEVIYPQGFLPWWANSCKLKKNVA